jgi:predicted nucleic acid-binding protein
MRAILDTNVVVDVLQRREPWFQDGAVIFRAIANKRVTGCLTAKQIADLYFFSRKQFKGEENVDARARQVVGKILSLFELIDTLGIDCQNALGVNNGDYEDAILIESAARAGVEYIVTRNPEHYKTSSVQVYSPAEFVRFISRQD